MARGVLTCEVSQGLWIVPAQCAIWIPGGTRHSVKGVGHIDAYILFVEAMSAPTMPSVCATVSISPLLREFQPSHRIGSSSDSRTETSSSTMNTIGVASDMADLADFIPGEPLINTQFSPAET
jgi:hypothetical protein